MAVFFSNIINHTLLLAPDTDDEFITWINQSNNAIYSIMHKIDRSSALSTQFFGMMHAVLLRVVEVNGNDVGIDEHSIQFLGCCADLVVAYLKGLLSKHEKWPSVSCMREIIVIGEVFDVSGMIGGSWNPRHSHRYASCVNHGGMVASIFVNTW